MADKQPLPPWLEGTPFGNSQPGAAGPDPSEGSFPPEIDDSPESRDSGENLPEWIQDFPTPKSAVKVDTPHSMTSGYWIAAVGVVLGIALVAFLVSQLPRGVEQLEGSPVVVESMTDLVPGSPVSSEMPPPPPVEQYCPVDQSNSEELIADGPGDPATAKGVIVSWAHALFQLKDATAVADFTNRGSGVVSEQLLAEFIGGLPEDLEWCITVTGTQRPDQFTAQIKYRPVAGDFTSEILWIMSISVARDGAGWEVVRTVDQD